ncbi:PREDICTED: BUD13 homolog [Tarenaya hassleriana]|uniref:BUD13 homolog n=1 Tax=Tarenaya hassleriana TaxID=28532 RepID=UPI00053C8E45|nr:PREDICTED: BUD13 homolog [Tarenaya hassleriana]
MAPPTTGAKSLKDYLKKYESSDVEEKKRKKKKKAKPEARGVLVVDEDPVWQKQVNLEEEENEDETEEKPLVDEDIEVKRMRRLEQIKARRAYNAIAEDGSGWVSLSPKRLDVGDEKSDISPPRRQRTRNDSRSPEPGSIPYVSDREDIDMSPPRRRKRHHTPSPDRKRVEPVGLDSDLSPPRKRKVRNDSLSPETEGRVPKKQTQDLSPPRKRYHSPSPEPGRKPSGSLGLNDDLSPPRRKRDIRSSPDQILRKRNKGLSPSHKRRYHSPSPEPSISHGLKGDLSPPRRRRDISGSPDSDLSPPRKTKEYAQPSSRNLPASTDLDISPPRKSGRRLPLPPRAKEEIKTGLISGRDIQAENVKTKKNEFLRFKEMDPMLSGEKAEGVFRDKITGKRISKEEYMKSKKKVEEKPKEIKVEWGKGLAQKREAEARLQELELEKDKPFARTRDDPELDNMLKDRIRWGDPMAHLVKKKRHSSALLDLGADEKMKESGFVIPQEIPSHSWLKRGLEAAPNRYGIRPGRHWDGVDRSNGYEKQLFKRMNEKTATEREAYLWSVSDM